MVSKKPYVILKSGEVIGLEWLAKPAKHNSRHYVDFADFFKKLIDLGPNDDEDYEVYLDKLQDMAADMFRQSPPPLEGLPYMQDLKKKGIVIHWE